MKGPITTLDGTRATRLGLAGYPDQDPGCIRRAFRRGINYFFLYGPGHRQFVEGLVPLLRRHRDRVIVATGSGSRNARGLARSRKTLCKALGVEMLDVFFAEYVSPTDDPETIFGSDGVLDELTSWKDRGWIRCVGATAHDRALARRLATDHRVDVLMHRFNMAHRKAAHEVFPAAAESRTPVVAFTATRWRTLLEPVDGIDHSAPTAAECYRYCLAHRPVEVVLTAPRDVAELDANLAVLDEPRMRARERGAWEAYADQAFARPHDRFETQYP